MTTRTSEIENHWTEAAQNAVKSQYLTARATNRIMYDPYGDAPEGQHIREIFPTWEDVNHLIPDWIDEENPDWLRDLIIAFSTGVFPDRGGHGWLGSYIQDILQGEYKHLFTMTQGVRRATAMMIAEDLALIAVGARDPESQTRRS